MPQRPQVLPLAATAQAHHVDGAECFDTPEPWELELAELMGRLSSDNREALLRIARAMAEAAVAHETA